MIAILQQLDRLPNHGLLPRTLVSVSAKPPAGESHAARAIAKLLDMVNWF
jgi:hypothetical protein